MAPRRRMKRISLDRMSLLTLDDLNSVDSKDLATQTFFDAKPQQALAVVPSILPSHTSSVTWKSQAIKDKEEYERLRQRVRHFAPEQFKINAKPGRGRSEIFPQNVTEWLVHRKEIFAMAEAENKKNCESLKGQIGAQQKIPKQQRKIKSVFGEGGKVFKDGLSPVLALPTIWSAEYSRQPANWPSRGELQWNGDSRQCSLAKTKCGRFLPPPRVSANAAAPFQEQPFQKQLPFDETGPVFASGPRPDEAYANNLAMNNDSEFETLGKFYLGTELMKEVGKWKPDFVPEWRQEQMAMNEGAMVVYQGDGFVRTPDIGSAIWYNGGVQAGTWEQYPVWW